MADCGCDISTGYLAAPAPCGPDGNKVVTSPGKVILFSPETPPNTKYSPSFMVTPGKAVLIDAYNMPDDRPIWVNRIIKSSHRAFAGDNCDPCAMHSVYAGQGMVTFRDRMRVGHGVCSWCLYKYGTEHDDERGSRTQLLIAVPGMYELELSDVNMLGDMEVEYMEWNIKDTPYLPKDYFAGTICLEGMQ